ncbi:dihydroxyacetone kinase [Xylariaceae sp. FL1019]|nr:dihydroxyacetone kinase [Xylariaceae sp. FL1019]
MSSKHFINNPTLLVDSALHSLTLTNPAVALDAENKIIYRRPSDSASQVALISGGGSGHEPSFGAFVGSGLLSAAVAGTIFASPSAEQVRKAIMGRVDAEKGVLVTVMNYTGDVLNFGVAVEKARAQGLAVEMLVVGDDVGVGRKKGGKVGRRGIAGTVLVSCPSMEMVHKIAGALAAQGACLDEVYKVAKLTADNLVSVGASLERVHVPGRVALEDGSLGPDEVEIGMGIHNEAGSSRAQVELPELVKTMLAQLLDKNDTDRAFLNVNSNEVVLLINNLGGVSVLELGGITAEVIQQLEQWGIQPVRMLTGTYMTSLNGNGFSISLLNVVNTDIGGPSMIQLLDYPCEATGWSSPIAKETWEARNTNTREDGTEEEQAVKPTGLNGDLEKFRSALTSGLEALVSVEAEVTKYDTVVGDGDCGIGLKRGAEAVLKHLRVAQLTGDLVVDVANIVPVIEIAMDGTSGALFAIFLNALVHSLQVLSPGEATAHVWSQALKQSCEALSKYTPARPGDRTLIDALYPFVDTLGSSGDLKQAAEASKKAAEGTKGMEASLGRAVYVGGSGFEQVPDPGAFGLASFFSGLAGLKPDEEGWETL